MLVTPRPEPVTETQKLRFIDRCQDWTILSSNPAMPSGRGPPGSASGPCFADPHSPWPRPFAPQTPQRPRPPCSPASPTSGESDFSMVLIGGYGSQPSRQSPSHDWRGRYGDLPVPAQKAYVHARVYDDAGSTSISRMRCPPWPSVGLENIGTPDLACAAQYLACTSPCERFASSLAD
jgi:hypothetical protein